jgi:hypothetical protein
MHLSDREAGATNCYKLLSEQNLKNQIYSFVYFIDTFSLNNSDNLKGRANFFIL